MAENITKTLYLSERGRLYRLAMRLIGNHASAEELVQDAFLRLMLRGDLEALTTREAYVARIVRNLALNRLRDEARRGETALEVEGAEPLAADQPGVEQILIARQDLMRVLGAIRALPPRRREAFVLHRFAGLTYDQIAARMGISRNTVMVQIVNALADLHRAFRENPAETAND